MRKLKQYEIYKLETTKFFKNKKIIPVGLNYEDAIACGSVVNIQNNQLINIINNYMKEKYLNLEVKDVIVNIVVPINKKKQGEEEYKLLATNGFNFNGVDYVRILSGAGQIRRNTITFIRKDFYKPILEKLLCGLDIEDFGDNFNAAKFNAYAGLNMSGCHLLPSALTPNVCVVDDMEIIKPHQKVNHVTEYTCRYITLPEKDILIDDLSPDEYEIGESKVIRKSDNVDFTIHNGINKNITVDYYDEIEDSPELNTFDGQGMMSPQWAEKVASYLSCGFLPSQLIIRAPWVKGLLATVPFHDFFKEHGVTEIIDAFGKARNVSDIDIIISKSQFKMHKIYANKFAGTNINPWDYHVDSMVKNHLHWGVVKMNSKKDDDEKALNYQYLQALDLNKKEIDALCKRTKDFLESLNCADINTLYNNLMANYDKFEDDENEDEEEAKSKMDLIKKLIKVCPEMLNDTYVREIILNECKTMLNSAKIGKLLVRGNFQFCVSDPVAQLEWILKKHCGKDIDVVGYLPAGCIYSQYWRDAEDKTEDITLMRSPLIDRNEIAKRKLYDGHKYYKYLKSGIVLSIHDLTALQLGGCDFDGDILFSTNNEIIANGCYDFMTAKPLYYKLDSTDLVGKITPENVIEADIRGLNSSVGTISNKGASLYAMLCQYDKNSDTYKNIYDSIIVLGQIVGMEIDRIKTAMKPTMPKEWAQLQPHIMQDANGKPIKMESDEEIAGIKRHNMLLPVIRPYYFRYIYNYIDDNIKQLKRSINDVSRIKYGINIETLIENCETGKATDGMINLYNQYVNAYPVNDSDCVVNYVCHSFEKFERDLHKQITKNTENKLKSIIDPQAEIDPDILQMITGYSKSYKKIKQIIVKRNNINSHDNHKNVKQKCNQSIKIARKNYRNKILDVVNDDSMLALTYLCRATNDVKIIWELMDKRIINILKGE